MTRLVWTALAAGAAMLLAGCRGREAAAPPVVRPVVTVTVQEPGGVRRRSFSGAARAPIETILSFRVGGEVAELPAKIGMPVHAGDVVARLDPTDYELQVRQLEAQLSQAAAQLEQASSEYERIRQLYEASSVSRSDLEAARAAYESAQAQKKAVEESLQLARQQLSYCVLHSPVDGRIASVEVEVHQTVQAGQPIAAVAAEGRMEMEVGLPEALISQVKVGDSAEVRFDAVPDRVLAARVTEVGVAPNESGVYPVRLTLAEYDPRIRPGMLGEATLLFRAPKGGRVIVPPVAVAKDPLGGNYVWVVDTNSLTVTRRDVEVGELLSEGLEIIRGLQPGERVVIRGVHRLSEGMKVRLLQEGERIAGIGQ